MDPASSKGSEPERNASLRGCVSLIFNLLRMYWLFELALLLVIGIGLRAGWSTQRQWSDSFFISGAIQVVIAGMMTAGSAQDVSNAASVRYMAGGNVGDTRMEILSDIMRKQSVGMRAFIGGVLTILIAVIVMNVK